MYILFYSFFRENSLKWPRKKTIDRFAIRFISLGKMERFVRAYVNVPNNARNMLSAERVKTNSQLRWTERNQTRFVSLRRARTRFIENGLTGAKYFHLKYINTLAHARGKATRG